jgi:hypothetical protein
MPDDLVDRVEEVIRATALAALGPDPSGELAAMNLPELLITLGNWRARFIEPRSRTVHESAELAASAKRVEYAVALTAIEASIRSGVDLAAHLSRRTRVSYEPKASRCPKLQRRNDLDLMLADWGLHHLHLSTDVEADGYVARTGDVLIGAFGDHDAHLVGIFPHDSWTEYEVIATVARNWPDRGIVHKLSGGHGLPQHPTPAERRSLRNAGVAVMLEIEGAVYSPSGQTTAGTSVVVTMQANQTVDAIGLLRRRLAESPTWLQEQLVEETGSKPGGEWMAHLHKDEVGLLHDKSGVFVPVLRIP